MASGSVVKGSQVPFSEDVYLLVSNAVHHRQAGLVSALLQGIPTKVLTHGGDTTCATVVTLDKSDGSSLYHFNLFLFFLRGGGGDLLINRKYSIAISV